VVRNFDREISREQAAEEEGRRESGVLAGRGGLSLGLGDVADTG
jgi:hypothetical protein